MPNEKVMLMMGSDIKKEVDEERKELSPPETRSRFFNVAAKDRLRRIKKIKARNA